MTRERHASAPASPLAWRGVALFVGLFIAAYAALAVAAERRVRAPPAEGPFQTLLTARGERVDWIVLGASHALPLAYGDVPGRLEALTGERMLVLAEVGAGPVYTALVARQALRDVAPARVLYVVDPFAYFARDWNAGRLEDRVLLARTPLRASTARLMAGAVRSHGVDPRALADYLTGFSKLNPPRRFETESWQGAAAFDRQARPSRHAVDSRVAYLYPDGHALAQARPMLAAFAELLDTLQAQGVEIVAVRLPLPPHFRQALPDTTDLQADLRGMLAARGVAYHDLSATLDDPGLYFDTDHLNREGVDALFDGHLKTILSGATPDAAPDHDGARSDAHDQ